MNKRRTHMEVIHDILGVVKNRNGGVKPTHILYKSNLSRNMMNEYLTELIQKRLLLEQKIKNGRTYILTPRGFEFLEKYELVKNFTNSFGLNYH